MLSPFTLSPFVRAIISAAGNWILSSGAWNDSKAWDDTANWID